jgi:hypothetical protein
MKKCQKIDFPQLPEEDYIMCKVKKNMWILVYRVDSFADVMLTNRESDYLKEDKGLTVF